MSNYNKKSITPYKNTSYKTTDSFDNKTSINSKDASVNYNYIVPAHSRPLTGMEDGGISSSTWYPSARPIKHWRKQLNPRLGSGVNGRRAGIAMSMDIPGGSSILGEASNCVSSSECTKTSTMLSDNILRPVSDKIYPSSPSDKYYDASNNEIVCVACNPEVNALKLVKPASTIISKKYYSDRKAYLQSRCLLYDQKLSGHKIPGITYWNTTLNQPILPSNDLLNGTQNRATENCLNCTSTVRNNTNTTIYKPSNFQYAKQGAVDSSSRITRLKYNTITKNGTNMQTAFGQAGSNANALYNGSDVSPYFLKNKNNINNCATYHINGNKTICPASVVTCPTKTIISQYDIENPITTQAQLEAFRGATDIIGSIFIEGFIGQPDFSVFDCLKTISGDFDIDGNANILTISGFTNLQSVGGYFFIGNNANLESISGFTNLQSVVDFIISNNNKLETISGFTNLTSGTGINETLTIVGSTTPGLTIICKTTQDRIANAKTPAITSLPFTNTTADNSC